MASIQGYAKRWTEWLDDVAVQALLFLIALLDRRQEQGRVNIFRGYFVPSPVRSSISGSGGISGSHDTRRSGYPILPADPGLVLFGFISCRDTIRFSDSRVLCVLWVNHFDRNRPYWWDGLVEARREASSGRIVICPYYLRKPA